MECEKIEWIDHPVFGYLLVRRRPCLLPRCAVTPEVLDIPIPDLAQGIERRRRLRAHGIISPLGYHEQAHEDQLNGCRGIANALLITLFLLGCAGIAYAALNHLGPFSPSAWK